MGRAPKIFAFEKDKRRSLILDKMVKVAGADKNVQVRVAKDFLATKPNSSPMEHVRALLLDPSCSGSGIVGRDDNVKVYLPDPKSVEDRRLSKRKTKKRKRPAAGVEASAVPSTPAEAVEVEESTPEAAAKDPHELEARLKALSSFQLHLLTHAMRFPNARKITYSTCSVYFEENEGVVFSALASSIAKERGWRTLPRDDQIDGMRTWNKRGVWEEGKLEGDVPEGKRKAEVLESCIRCEKGTNEGTMGFFVAAFARDDTIERVEPPTEAIEEDGEEEWSGFSDEDMGGTVELRVAQVPAPSKTKKPKNRK
jgi:putative methyltransferase